MNKIFTLIAIAALSSASALAAGKGASVTAANVFSHQLLQTITDLSYGDKYTFNYNDRGQLLSTVLTGEWSEMTTFDYSGGTYSDFDYDVRMTTVNPDETLNLYISVNDLHFASRVYQEITPNYGVPEHETWAFTYNTDGQLLTMTCSEGLNPELTTITYANGDIVKVQLAGDDDAPDYSTISYPDAIPNTAGIMLFDATLAIDMDELGMAYFAGLLGRPTAHLPQSTIDADGYRETYTWTINPDGFPAQLAIADYYDNDTFQFTWETNPALDHGALDTLAAAPATQSAAWYTPQGIRLARPTRGLNILAHPDGTTTKHLLP